MGLFLCFLLCSKAFGQKSELTTIEKLQYTRNIEDVLLRTIKTNSAITNSSQDNALLHLSAEFDESQFKNDQQAFFDAFNLRKQNQLKTVLKQTETTEASGPAIVVESSGLRLGRLNLDLKEESVQKVLSEKDLSDTRPISLNLSVGTFEPQFVYDIGKYLKSIKGDLIVDSASSDQEIEKLKEALSAKLQSLGIKASSDWLSVQKRLPPPAPKPHDVGGWVGSIFAPENNALVILISCFMIGCFILIATLLLAKVFGKVAMTIGDLKPAEESGSNDEAAQAAARVEEVVVENVVEEDSRYDKGASVTAMTSEMRTIRDQLSELINENTAIIAELLSDMFYEKKGLQDIRDLLSYVGYKALKPSMSLLPAKALGQLRQYIEESRDEQVSLLVGVEVAQRLYRDCVSKCTDTADESQAVEEFRKTLIATDNEDISAILSDFEAVEVAQLLKYMSYERSTVFMRSLSTSILKSTTDVLDLVPEDLDATLSKIEQKLKSVTKSDSVQVLMQERLILRLAQQADVGDGERVFELVEPTNAALKLKILSRKFFCNYLKYLPLEFIRKAVNRIDLKTRAEFIFLQDDSTKEHLLSVYQEGSKLKEMVDNELQLIGNNEEMQLKIRKNQLSINQRCMDIIASGLDDSTVKTAIVADLEKNNLQVPDAFIDGSFVPEPEGAKVA